MEDSSGKELQSRVRTLTQSSPGEIIYALQAVSGIHDAVVIIHGALGCAASGVWFNSGENRSWYTTNLNESDTILGGDEKLRAAILRAYNENHPEAIFIIGTPIIAINNDDVDSVVIELSDELGCKIIYIDVNGFKTKNALSGYDVIFHGFLKHLVEPKQNPVKPFLNLFTVSESPDNVAAIVELLQVLDIPCNIVPRFSGLNGIRRASGALCSVSLDDAENEYIMTGLEEQYGVPVVKTNPPIGTAGVYDFIKKIAAHFDRNAQAETLIKDEEQKISGRRSKKPFAGKKILLEADLHRVVSFSSLIEELGGEISGIVIPHLDIQNAGKLKDLSILPRTVPFIVAQGQQFEIANVLNRYPADFYIGRSETAAAAARFGAIPLPLDGITYYGYRGIGEVVKRALKLGTNNNYVSLLGQKLGAPYSESWLKRSGNWYVKFEVK
ncbi:putative oxidoreductase/nitrogenase, component 1 [Treponema primitia ZAS-2]|uniref:Putative oxidoreductase/nitrogenase, component 1 n=1 Tax=Treponema primitia (strain ATCC BAA-887 / DSM 12427 / ZAS-2) TaxID=545694 RepID=F5YLJ9_TREPZ|nr:putative oxidoreductase/nitrogenase, component 1 [Treponema primitia ZAS-2]